MGIEVLGPCVNHSAVKFRPETMPNGHLAVRFGLAAVKSMSSDTVRVIEEEREAHGPYTSLEDFCYRIPPQNVRRNQIEVLVQCGAFDCMHVSRAALFENIDRALNGAATVHRDNEAGQMALFDMTTTAVQESESAPVISEWPKQKRLDEEKSLTGAYFTGNPLDAMRGIIDQPKYVSIGNLPDLTRDEIQNVRDMAGMIRSVAIKTSKSSNQRFAVITIEDFTGSTEALVWGDSYKKAADVDGLLQEGSFIRFRARISEDDRTGGKRVSANGLELINSATHSRRGKASSFYPINLLTTRHDSEDIILIKKILAEHPGNVPVRITFRNSLGNSVTIQLSKSFAITPSPGLDRCLSRYA